MRKREQFHNLQPAAKFCHVQHLQQQPRLMSSCVFTTTQYLTVQQMQAQLELPQLQLHHLEPHPQLLTWKGYSQQPCPPQKLPLRGLPHSCGHPQAQLKSGGAWVALKQAWVCKEASHSLAWEPHLVWGFSPVLQSGTWLVSCLVITDCNLGVAPDRRLENQEKGGSKAEQPHSEALYTLGKPSTS